MLTTAQILVVLCLVTLDEGQIALSGREAGGVAARRMAQMDFIRNKAAALGGQTEITDDDWAVANAWVQEALPQGYLASSRHALEGVMHELPRPLLRKALEVVSAVVQWDGVTTDEERDLFHDLAALAKMNDRLTLEEIERVGKRLSHVPPATHA